MIADSVGCLSRDYMIDVARKTHLHETVEDFPKVGFSSVIIMNIM